MLLFLKKYDLAVLEMFCIYCGKEIQADDKFCMYCGKENCSDDKYEKYKSIAKDAVKTTSKIAEKAVVVFAEKLNKINLKQTVETDAFLFCFGHGEVTTKKIDTEQGLSLSDGLVVFECDYKGNYLKVNDTKTGEPVWYNGKLADVGEKYYLVNDDVIALQRLFPNDSVFFLYCVQNERDTIWHYNDSVEFFKKDEEGEFRFEPNAGLESVQIYHVQKKDATSIQPFDCGVVAGRHFLYDGIKFYIQEEPSREQQKSLSFVSNQLKVGEQLKINIVERVVSEGTEKQRKLLENINVSIDAGEMVLVLGGSGAGKTTFFNAVMGKEKADATIMIGEHDLYQNYTSVQRMIGFVPQTETLRPYDTVYMTLKTAALLKLPKEITTDQNLLEGLISNVLKKLGIEKEADNLVSKLSGGQKKRLSVATEYITEPAVFFLDEPDSGLDGNQAQILMQNLRDIADDNKIVVVISHAPDRTKELFDKVIVLAKGAEDNCGHLAYYGKTNDALTFFGVDTLEEIVRCIELTPDYYISKFEDARTNFEENS